MSYMLKLLSTVIVTGNFICDNSLSWPLYLNLTYRRLWSGVGNSLLIWKPRKLSLFKLLVWNQSCKSLTMMSLFRRIWNISFELSELVPLPYSPCRPTCYSKRLHDFSAIISKHYKDIYVNGFLRRTSRPWTSLPE